MHQGGRGRGSGDHRGGRGGQRGDHRGGYNDRGRGANYRGRK